MTDLDRIQMRVAILQKEIKPPRTTSPDEVSACLHDLAIGLVDLGGVKVLENAVSVLTGAITAWPEDRRPSEMDILRRAAWAIKQDPCAEPDMTAKGNIYPLRMRIEDAIAGELVAVPWPWDSVASGTNALLPGAITLLVGSPGASKSFMLFQAALYWIKGGWKTTVYALEEDPAFWLHRALALVAGCGALTDPAWLAVHPDRARALLAEHEVELNGLAARLTCAPPEGIDLRGLAEWIAAQAKAGQRIICADPITAASVGAGKPWLAAEDFMLRIKRAAVEHGASVVLTSHGRKGDSKGKTAPDLDSLAGGAAYARFASTVLWLEACEPEPSLVIDADGGQRTCTVNRRVRVLKSRNGPATGKTIAMWFDGQTLATNQAGVVVPGRARPDPESRRGEKLRSQPSEREDLFNRDTP